jgi:hypothetical protein
MANENLAKLQGDESKKGEGSWVFTHQGVAADQGFRNVSKHWYKSTLSYEQGLNQLEAGRAKTHDILCTFKEIKPTVKDGKFVMEYKDGRVFTPTEYAIKQMGNKAGCGTWYVESMLSNPTDAKERELFQRDSQDAETLAKVFQNGFRRLDQDKKFLWRTREDGTLRALLTDRFAIVDNRWFISLLQSIIPGGRLSHWKDDSDTLWGNILIPDTIREEKDSDYGGMLSVGNSEIGERRVKSLPSIFRAICMNGCIWGATIGKGIKQVHRGKIDLGQLAKEIKENLNLQIPLLPTGIDRLLKTRDFAWDGASAKVVIAQLARDNKFSKKQATAVLQAYHVEREQTSEFAKTLFGLTNSVTRAGQLLTTAEWVRFDEIGGQLSEYSKDKFDNMVSQAKRLDTKEVEEVYANAA